MQQLNSETGTENYETAYKKTGGFLVIELHRMLFPENENGVLDGMDFLMRFINRRLKERQKV